MRRPRLPVALLEGICGLWLLTGLLSLSLPSHGLTQSADFDLVAAIAQAEPGATIVVPPGSYAGPLFIDKPLTLVGEHFPEIVGAGRGDVIRVDAPHVTIRGFVIRNSGASLDQENAGITVLQPFAHIEDNRFEDVLFGIYLKDAPYSTIRANHIRGKELEQARRGDAIRAWYSEYTRVEQNHVSHSRDVIIWFSPHSIISHNTVEYGRYGLHFMFSDDQRVEDNVLRYNSVGAFLMYGRGLTLQRNLFYRNRGPSGYGIGMKDMDDVVASGNRMVSNRIGVYVDNSPREAGATVRFDHNLIAYNEMGLALLPLVKHNTYTLNVFQENDEQIALIGGGQLLDNAWSIAGYGNFWSDYAGFDADGDQIGDLPYRAQSLFEDLLQTYPELRLLHMSPITAALDLAARAFPIFQPRAKVTDPHPLIVPPSLPPIRDSAPPAGARALIAAVVMLTLGLAVLAAGLRSWSSGFQPFEGTVHDYH